MRKEKHADNFQKIDNDFLSSMTIGASILIIGLMATAAMVVSGSWRSALTVFSGLVGSYLFGIFFHVLQLGFNQRMREYYETYLEFYPHGKASYFLFNAPLAPIATLFGWSRRKTFSNH
jgi:hypothetical protein